MESSRKRKAAPATPSASEGTGLKKLKLSNSAAAPRPAATDVHTPAQKLIDHLKRAADKTGRPIATQFLTLPDRNALPDYYRVTRLPLAVDTIEAKLANNGYPTLTTFESDFKRLVQNAKDYNAPKSEIYEDAERVRKLVYNFMKVNNPEYKTNPDYVSFPTPLPAISANDDQIHVKQNGHKHNSSSRDVSERPDSRSARRSTAPKASEGPSDRKGSVARSATTGADDDADEDEDAGPVNASGEVEFTGKSFQEAQQLIISTLLNYKDDEDGVEIYTPFALLPSRKLEDYYQVIRHPVSLKSVAKRCKGVHGRAAPTGITDFKNWQQFEDEVSHIWRNAQLYNEDESDMYKLADEFKEHFQELLAKAKATVEPAGAPKIKLGGPKPPVTLNLTAHRDASTPGVAVDNEALARQRQMVQAGVNGQQQPAHLTNGNMRNGSPHISGIKTEKTQSPAPQSLLQTNGMMPPPSMRPTSDSPYPPQNHVSSYHFTAPAALPPLPIRPYPVEDALLPGVTISTHPQLKVPKPLNISIGPHATQAQQSATITISASHYYLQIAPTISKQLSMGRPYKMFVTVNGSRLNQRDTIFHAETGKRTHVYEGTLAHGVNRIEVEVAAAKQDGDSKGLDVEKVTCFAHLTR